MPKVSGIYQITSPSGKVYIGQSWDVARRFRMYSLGHCTAQRHLYNSLNKYGFQRHKLGLLDLFTGSMGQAYLDQREQFWIDKRRNEGCVLLNLREGGSTGKLSAETCELLRRANTGKKASAETRAKQSAWQIGRKRPHIAESNKRRAAVGTLFLQNRPAPRGKDHPRFGMRHSPESIAKMCTSQRGHQRATAESRAAVSAKVRGEGNAAAILTESQVREIRTKYQPYKYERKTLAAEYGVSVATIAGIVDGRLWKHLLERNHEWPELAGVA